MAEVKGVHRGRDGWLFWLGANGRVPDLWREGGLQAALRGLRVARRVRRIQGRAVRARALGARFLQIFAPDKFSVYGDLADLPGIDPALGFGEQVARRSPWTLDLSPRLRTLREEGVQAVLRTDTHWTPRGYLAVHAALCDALGADPAAHVAQAREGEAAPALFDLGSKLDPPVREPFAPLVLARRAQEVDANAVVLRNRRAMDFGDREIFKWSRRVLARPDAPDPRRLVVFGDSYVFDAAHGLGGLLAETFREVHMLWSPAVDWGYVSRVRPDVVIAETAERWVRVLPRDAVDVDALAQARVRARPGPAG